MKRILIVNNNLYMGGVQKALISLLWNIRGRYDVTLLLFHDAGDCADELPPDIHVITVKSGFRYLGMTRHDTNTLCRKLGRGFYAGITRLFGRRLAVSLMGIGQKKLTGYDAVISYLHNSGNKVFYGGCNEFVLRHTEAKRKIAFLHCDYTLCGADTPQNARQYSVFDIIAACSKGCRDAFLRSNPQLKEKVRIVPNCHRFDQIQKLAAAAPEHLPKDRLNIVTVARLGKEKGVHRAVEAIGQLGNMQQKLHYYIIGDGIERPQIESMIDRFGLQDTVSLCGQMKNPYGYIAAADWLLIPSYSEAAPLVIGEAAGLGTPVLSTETSSAHEMLTDTGFGRVCDNSVEGLTAALQQLLDEPLSKKAAVPVSNDTALTAFDQCI